MLLARGRGCQSQSLYCYGLVTRPNPCSNIKNQRKPEEYICTQEKRRENAAKKGGGTPPRQMEKAPPLWKRAASLELEAYGQLRLARITHADAQETVEVE
jgi:hypothetical protein